MKAGSNNSEEFMNKPNGGNYDNLNSQQNKQSIDVSKFN